MSGEAKVTAPYENTRKRPSQGGRFPWSVTISQGCRAEVRTFWDRAEADELFERAVAVGFRAV